MKTAIEKRPSTHPDDVKRYDTELLRRRFLIERIFEPDAVLMTYSFDDRLIVGGAMPVGEALTLEAPEEIRSAFFCERREVGVVCIEGEGVLEVDGAAYKMGYKDAVYVGRGSREVSFRSVDGAKAPAKFYFAPAHASAHPRPTYGGILLL